jgi:hypothetical protein
MSLPPFILALANSGSKPENEPKRPIDNRPQVHNLPHTGAKGVYDGGRRECS